MAALEGKTSAGKGAAGSSALSRRRVPAFIIPRQHFAGVLFLYDTSYINKTRFDGAIR